MLTSKALKGEERHMEIRKKEKKKEKKKKREGADVGKARVKNKLIPTVT